MTSRFQPRFFVWAYRLDLDVFSDTEPSYKFAGRIVVDEGCTYAAYSSALDDVDAMISGALPSEL